MSQYILTREPVRYPNDTWSQRFYYMGSLLGFAKMTAKVEEAERFTNKAKTEKMAKMLGKNWSVMKVE